MPQEKIQQKTQALTLADVRGPKHRYDVLLQARKLQEDALQAKAIGLLDGLFMQLLPAGQERKTAPSFFSRIFSGSSKPKTVKNLYFWGDVGRGKSMVMDLFARAAKPHLALKRIHFHAFMLDVHKRLHAFRAHNSGDVMPDVIKDLANEQRVLCLDEFEVHDITDASILARLFGGLMAHGVVTIFTSNREPHGLYPNGLQREQFLKFIDDVLLPNSTVFALNGKEDYRLKQLSALKEIYHYPRDEKADAFLMESWQMLVGDTPVEPLEIEVNGRKLCIEKHVNGVAWLTFNELCRRPLGASDYLEISQVLHTVLLQGIPALSREERNEARRFIMLVDALYDHRIKCVFTAQTAPEGIYADGDGNFEFARTASRLTEMQSANYLAQTKRQA